MVWKSDERNAWQQKQQTETINPREDEMVSTVATLFKMLTKLQDKKKQVCPIYKKKNSQ